MSLTSHEKKVLAALEYDLRVDAPGLAAALATDPASTGRSNSRPRGGIRDQHGAGRRGFSPALRAFLYVFPVGLLLSVAGAVVGLLWMVLLGALVLFAATGCTMYEAFAGRESSR